MLLPISTDRPLTRPPVANLTIMVVTIAMHAVQRLSPAVDSALLARPYDPDLLGFAGSAFLHAGMMHLLGNMLFLYIFGNSVNDRLGHAAYVGFYLAGGIAASLLTYLFSDRPGLGASGAVSAVTGAYLVLFPRTRVNLIVLFVIITRISVPAIWFVGLYFLVDLYQGVSVTYLDGYTGVGHWAHVGGSVYGILVAFLVLRFALLEREKFDLLAALERRKLRHDVAADRKRLGQVHGSAMDVVPKSQEDPKVAKTQDLRAQINDAIEKEDLSAAAGLYEELLAVDDKQILGRASQFEVTNQLYREEKYAAAAKGYRLLLDRFAPKTPDDEIAQVRLILGLVLGRYLNEPAEAQQHLQAAAVEFDALQRPDDAAFARGECEALPTSPSSKS